MSFIAFNVEFKMLKASTINKSHIKLFLAQHNDGVRERVMNYRQVSGFVGGMKVINKLKSYELLNAAVPLAVPIVVV